LKKNIKSPIKYQTHEGGQAHKIDPIRQLRRSVMACMLWEDQFYEDGQSIAERIEIGVAQVEPIVASNIAIEARTKANLRHAPLLIAKAMANIPSHRSLVGETLRQIIQRPDELTEFLSLYWLEGKKPLAAQIKKGLAKAFQKFNAYQLAKYNRDAAVKLRDVLFLCHAKPLNAEQETTWKQLIDGTLPSPDTWEVGLSTGGDKKETFERLLKENKLGAMALLRNLRNMHEAGVHEGLIFCTLDHLDTSRVLPFRFISAAKYAPQWEAQIEKVFLKQLNDKPKIPGGTVILVDTSGSMIGATVSQKSEIDRLDAACGLAMIAREWFETVYVHAFGTSLHTIPARHGFALRDAIRTTSGGATFLAQAIKQINLMYNYDRIIVITDEQSHDGSARPLPMSKAYMINVATYQHGVGYGPWNHIDGFSEAILEYIIKLEDLKNA